MGAVVFYNSVTGFGMTTRIASANTGTRTNLPILKGETMTFYYDGSIVSSPGSFFRFYYSDGSQAD